MVSALRKALSIYKISKRNVMKIKIYTREFKTYTKIYIYFLAKIQLCKILQKFTYNYSIAQVLPYAYICPKKISNFSLEHLFTFCTRQSTARTTIAAIVGYRAIIRNIEWSKYKREVSAKG